MAGIDRYRTLAGHHRVSDWLRFGGGLSWTTTAEAQRMPDWHCDEWARGYESHLLGHDGVAERIGGVDPDAVAATGAVWNPGEGWVDLPSLVRFLIKDFRGRAAELVTRAGHCRVSVIPGRVDRREVVPGALAFTFQQSLLLEGQVVCAGVEGQVGRFQCGPGWHASWPHRSIYPL